MAVRLDPQAVGRGYGDRMTTLDVIGPVEAVISEFWQAPGQAR
jgi:hypothetical protein